MRNYLEAPRHAVRRQDRAVEDDDWIRYLLARAPFGVLATVHDAQPFTNANLFAYATGEHAIYMHTARTGRTEANVEADERVCFTAFEMGRLLPAPRAFNMSVEYSGVVAFGRGRVLDDNAEKERGLQMLIDKYFAHLTATADYELPSEEELRLTAVYRIAIDAWSGKKKAVGDHEGAFMWGESPTVPLRRTHDEL
jgi:nitroimidazol reductase NimA-like FMN-containing flavoprotein (pyridoxamine 5'-phosphate oxidase superfamily)